jgi:hypothetical protein
MIDKNQVELSVVGKISDIGEQDWDACASNGYDGRHLRIHLYRIDS